MATFKDKVAFPLSSISTWREKPPSNARMASKTFKMKLNPRVASMSLKIFQGRGQPK